ncbi:hypothetical protein P4Y08_31780, partial [Bacillus thuringiensis]|nr:hypothetical protein [Bacillus thuringiensis]
NITPSAALQNILANLPYFFHRPTDLQGFSCSEMTTSSTNIFFCFTGRASTILYFSNIIKSIDTIIFFIRTTAGTTIE